MNFAILIATRNRPQEVSQLLNSVQSQAKLPMQVIVVSSGEKIAHVIEVFREKLTITHEHLDSFGQIRQKMFGITKVSKEVGWVLFLDDDVTLRPNTLQKLAEFIKKLETDAYEQVVGIGLKIPSSSHLKDGKLKKAIAKLFFLDSRNPGHVLKSGHPVDYLRHNSLLKTHWLNGISAWRVDACRTYRFDFLESRYSAFEDVSFSFHQRNKGILLFNPEIEIDLQSNVVTDLSNKNVFIAGSFWRLKFILENLGFSRSAYIWSQVGRSLFFIFQNVDSLGDVAQRLKIAVKVFFEILFQIAYKKDANWSLRRHCTSKI